MASSNPKPKSYGEQEHHVVAVRMRVNGSGSLRMRLMSLDDVRTQTLIPFTMATSTDIEPTRLANFQSQRIRLEFKTIDIDETFIIGRIIIFAKPVNVGEKPM